MQRVQSVYRSSFVLRNIGNSTPLFWCPVPFGGQSTIHLCIQLDSHCPLESRMPPDNADIRYTSSTEIIKIFVCVKPHFFFFCQFAFSATSHNFFIRNESNEPGLTAEPHHDKHEPLRRRDHHKSHEKGLDGWQDYKRPGLPDHGRVYEQLEPKRVELCVHFSVAPGIS
jgi:hypothetical protein